MSWPYYSHRKVYLTVTLFYYFLSIIIFLAIKVNLCTSSFLSLPLMKKVAGVEEKSNSSKAGEAGEWERKREWKNFMINKLYLVYLYHLTSVPLD